MPFTQQPRSGLERAQGAVSGLFIGDALAMPVHWYYRRAELLRDYGHVIDYLAPREPHPDSILWRSSYAAPGPAGEILHDRAHLWGRRGVHYHGLLAPGENTINLQLCRVLFRSLAEQGGYDADDYLRRYIAFMTTPGTHRDTYLEECHRHFFAAYARGVPPRECAAVEKHIGGLVGVVPVVCFHRSDPPRALRAAIEHLQLTHAGERMRAAGTLLAELLLEVLDGEDLCAAIRRRVGRGPFLELPLERWLSDPDDVIIGRRLSPACYIDEALPAVLYLALKYAGDPEAGLIANTNLGGDNAHRGAVLGALLGAHAGESAWPERWRSGLFLPAPQLVDQDR